MKWDSDVDFAHCENRVPGNECAPFNALFRNSVMPMLLIDPQDGRIVDANQAAVGFYGYPPETLIGKPIGEINTLTDDMIQQEMQKAHQAERNFFNFQHRRAKGDICDVEVSSGPVFIDGKELLFSLIRDVTRRNRAEAALERKNQALSAYGQCSAAIIHGESERQILDSICQILVHEVGYANAWIGYALNDPEKRIEVQACFGEGCETLSSCTISWDGSLPQGGGPFGKVIRNGRSVQVDNTQLDRDFSYWRDMPQHVSLRSLLAIPLKRGASVYGVLVIGASEVDGFDAEANTLLSQMSENLSFGISTIRASERQQRLEQRLMWEKKDLLKTQQDLQDAHESLKATQAQMVAQEKLASVGQLAAGVAHEINNPTGFIASNLNSLKKYAERLFGYIDQQKAVLNASASKEQLAELDRYGKELKVEFLSEDLIDLIDESIDGTERISSIVKSLKSFARTDGETVTATDLNECLQSTITIARNEFKYKAELVQELEDLPKVQCNAQKINQVFMNLLVNAAQAIKETGTIWVRSRVIDGCVRIEVEDTGAGIPAEVQGRIFEPFFTTKEVGKGTGLGMSIAADIVEKHRGQLTFTSELGKGTCFVLMLPITQEG